MTPAQTESARPPARHRLRTVVVGSILGSLALWLAFRDLGAAELAEGFRRIDPWWAVASLASTGVSLALLTWRWQLLFYPRHRERRFWPLFRAVVVGQMLNIVSPLRLGELGRMYLAAREEQLSRSQVLATLIVEKALDLGMFAVAAAVTLTFVALPEGVGLRRSAQWGIAVAGLAAMWLASRHAERLEAIASRIVGRLPGRAGERVSGIALRFLEGLGALSSPGVALAAIAWTVAVVLSAALTNYLLFRAFGWTLPPVAALFLLVLIQAGFVPPSLPGRIGIFHYMVVAGLAAFDIERGPALAYAWALYAVALLPKVVLGAGVLAAGRWGEVVGALRSDAADVGGSGGAELDSPVR